MSDRTVRVDDLVGTVEIAQRLGVRDHNVVNMWRRRHPDFPQPVATLRHGRIWAWPDVEAWARKTDRLRKRKPAKAEEPNDPSQESSG